MLALAWMAAYGWAYSSAASLATEVPCAYPVVSEELTENGCVEHVRAMLVGHVTGGWFVFLCRFQLVHLAPFGCWMFGGCTFCVTALPGL